MILSVSISIYLVPITNWARAIICSGLWHLRCHLLSGKLGISHIGEFSTALIQPSCSLRCSLPLALTVTTTTCEHDSKLESFPKSLRFPSIRETYVASRKAPSPGRWSFIVSSNSFHLLLPPLIPKAWRKRKTATCHKKIGDASSRIIWPVSHLRGNYKLVILKEQEYGQSPPIVWNVH